MSIRTALEALADAIEAETAERIEAAIRAHGHALPEHDHEHAASEPDPDPTPDPEPDPVPDPDPIPGPIPSPTPQVGLIISDLAALPTSGIAWSKVAADAGRAIAPSLSDQDSPANVRTLAAALAAARTGDSVHRNKVITALRTLPGLPIDRALALGRELPAYVIAADLTSATDAELGFLFGAWLRRIVVAPTSGGPSSLVECAAIRPNNWGTHAFGALAAVWAYLGDDAELDKLHRIVLGWLGDRSRYAGFRYGDLSWQADPGNPVGVNPAGATIQGHDVSGALPEEMRRSGGFSWPPPKQNYAWEALQGATLAALILERTGRSVWAAGDKALLRAYLWLTDTADYAPTGDDTWIAPLIDHAYGGVAWSPGTSPGKNFGYTDWLFG